METRGTSNVGNSRSNLLEGNFVAIDFENADNDQLACALGVVVVRNWQIVDTRCWLIKPHDNKYGRWQTKVHGIIPLVTACKPEFTDIYEEVKELLHGQILVAHNYSTDRAILRKTCEYYNLDPIVASKWYCTYEIYGDKLGVCCQNYKIALDHHNALSDALACAKLFIIDHKKATPQQRKEWSSEINEKGPSIYDGVVPFVDVDNTDIDFNGKKFVITGQFNKYFREEIAEVLIERGGLQVTTVSKRTSYLIAGFAPGPSKVEQAISLNVQIIDECGFEKWLIKQRH